LEFLIFFWKKSKIHGRVADGRFAWRTLRLSYVRCALLSYASLVVSQ